MRDNTVPCTAGEPSTLARIHPDAVVIRAPDDLAFSADNKTRYRCPNCALEFGAVAPAHLWGA